ncbi:hypothetical protein GGR36_002800 [Niveibacterium umoris]|uniref:Uncharacterized protein n=1 Tax=Niveibacterium umoris TaxID=1193620 RepID=A0A840BLV3_9RHOO|nr:hypothetical protein [Niveibacterium umoris]
MRRIVPTIHLAFNDGQQKKPAEAGFFYGTRADQ